ncbi:hypothetical protein [Synechococcus sp. PCC 6312]|uniref:hypothetical protein n=1 Tax=Synechococcus sp. (strain ATCC 27167 / PCC 6312) TaxID=195253 RepID=UPI0002E0E0C0|nr:hypothetical protein [Synechococcus sp. PCC 6312]
MSLLSEIMVKTAVLPPLMEYTHPLVQPLLKLSDQALVESFQQQLQQGRYFVAIFARYAPLVYSVLSHHARSQVQIDFLYAKTWQTIFVSLHAVKFTEAGVLMADEDQAPVPTFRAWVLNQVAACVHSPVPPIESISYTLQVASPPFWCYLEAALAYLPALTRLILVTTQTFHWNTERLIAFLEAEDQPITLGEISQHLQNGYQLLRDCLPGDVQTIYLSQIAPARTTVSQDFHADLDRLANNLFAEETLPIPA